VNLFDASAILAFLQEEDGSDVVEAAFEDDPRCSAVNWSEVAQKIRSHGGDWSVARALLFSYGVQVEPVQPADAERAAALWRAGSGLSLADRLCLATGSRLNAHVWTADSAWGRSERLSQIR
jgi:ribonuclease VapC